MTVSVEIKETELNLPKFSALEPSKWVEQLQALLNQNRSQVEVLALQDEPTYASLMYPLEELSDHLNRFWSPIGHLNGVADTPDIRSAYEQCLPLLSQYSSELGQHKGLYQAIKKIKRSKEFDQLTQAEKRAVEQQILDFELAGVGLDDAKQTEYREIQSQLSDLSNKFKNNVLDATHAWQKHITDVTQLTGVPESTLSYLAQQASQKKLEGWCITLDFPSYLPVMTFADNRELRKELHQAFVTRASSEGPNAGEFNNDEIMMAIHRLRQQKAQLLGYKDYAAYSLATKMADSADQVVNFLEDLAKRSLPQAKKEIKELEAFAVSLGIQTLEPWDVAYVAEKLKQQTYQFSQEEVKPYFPVSRVLNGLFATANKLFNVDVQEQPLDDSYHPDVRLYNIRQNEQIIARFYLDLYAREGKGGGAWMDECRVKRITATGQTQLPVAYLVCNFTPPVGDKESTLTHDEVTTLFHEFGHGIHHMLTEVTVAEVSGINNVEWDAVELPSQFLENWCWNEESLALISGHIDTGEPLPKKLLEKMLAAKNFQSAMAMVRQLEFGLFDMKLHQATEMVTAQKIQAILDGVRDQVSVVPTLKENRFQNSFSHIFGGGYAAGYYSYKWAEVLSADAFSRFEENGIYDQATGHRFLNELLSQGGSQSAKDLFKQFMGREPSIQSLLRHSGIEEEAA